MTCVIHLFVKDPDDQSSAILLSDVKQHMPTDMVCAQTRIDFIERFAYAVRSASYFVHARYQKGIVRIRLFFRPGVYSILPNLVEVFGGLLGDIILCHVCALSSAAGVPADRNLQQYHCSIPLRWQSGAQPFFAPYLPEAEGRNAPPRWRCYNARS